MLSPERLRDILLELGGESIDLIILFGSRARGDSHLHSDTDIAIHTTLPGKETRWNLLLQLTSAVNGPNFHTDLVILEDVDWSLKYRIARDGKVLYERDHAWARFKARVMKYYPDYRIFEKKYLDMALRGL
ncbi:MAG: nucleotidyltransferase domain-containing protein [Candidatus Thorarchaeota archaeon]|nr:nucleotidyltransferase domain-containing protein [Candidatus Thorarchaeota archaeon]